MALFNFWHKKKEESKEEELFPKIDLHAHILPDVDDGSKDEAMTLEMMEAALKAYVVHINATAHHRNSLSPEVEVIGKAFARTKEMRDKNLLPLSLSCSFETEFYPEVENLFRECRIRSSRLINTSITEKSSNPSYHVSGSGIVSSAVFAITQIISSRGANVRPS